MEALAGLGCDVRLAGDRSRPHQPLVGEHQRLIDADHLAAMTTSHRLLHDDPFMLPDADVQVRSIGWGQLCTT